jgi:hypothetical protein
MKIKIALIAVLVLIGLNVMAYSAGKFSKTWKNPDAKPVNWKGKKVAAFAWTALNANREAAENALARELTQRGAQAVAGHTLIPPEAEKDREAAKRILAAAGITGAVMMRVADLQQETVTTSGQAYYLGPNYSSFWGYWDSGMIGYVPGMVDTKVTVVVETLVYSIDQDRLLWTGTSETTNPKKADDVIKKLVGAAAGEVKKAGLLKK